jgi:hypothetical protein
VRRRKERSLPACGLSVSDLPSSCAAARSMARAHFSTPPGPHGVEPRDILQHRHRVRTDRQRQGETKAFMHFGGPGGDRLGRPSSGDDHQGPLRPPYGAVTDAVVAVLLTRQLRKSSVTRLESCEATVRPAHAQASGTRGVRHLVD